MTLISGWHTLKHSRPSGDTLLFIKRLRGCGLDGRDGVFHTGVGMRPALKWPHGSACAQRPRSGDLPVTSLPGGRFVPSYRHLSGLVYQQDPCAGRPECHACVSFVIKASSLLQHINFFDAGFFFISAMFPDGVGRGLGFSRERLCCIDRQSAGWRSQRTLACAPI